MRLATDVEGPALRAVSMEPGGAFARTAPLRAVQGFAPLAGAGFAPSVVRTFPASVPAEIAREFENLRLENDQLRAEVHHLRRRDDTVNYTINRIDEELRLAAKLQRDFMPRHLSSVGRARFHTLYRPASYVSGDLYELSRLDERHVGFYMADAVGHGMPAALLTMFMRQALQTKEIANNTYRLLRPSETLRKMNEVMVEQDLSQATFATAVCGVLNTETGALLVSSAGHPRPIVVPRVGESYELETEGSLMGIFPDESYTDVEWTLNAGDRLILYTDGTEVAFRRDESASDSPLFDNDRWKTEMLSKRDESAEEMLLHLSATIDAQPGSLTPPDDLTIIVVDFGDV